MFNEEEENKNNSEKAKTKNKKKAVRIHQICPEPHKKKIGQVLLFPIPILELKSKHIKNS